MAQYFKTVLVTNDSKKFIDSTEYNVENTLIELYKSNNTFINTIEREIFEKPTSLCFAGEYAEKLNTDDILYFEENNIYNLCSNTIEKIRPRASKKIFKYIINNNTKEFIDKTTMEVNPLPILCCDFNYNDYNGNDKQYVGKWSRNTIWTTSNEKHLKQLTEVTFNFR